MTPPPPPHSIINRIGLPIEISLKKSDQSSDFWTAFPLMISFRLPLCQRFYLPKFNNVIINTQSCEVYEVSTLMIFSVSQFFLLGPRTEMSQLFVKLRLKYYKFPMTSSKKERLCLPNFSNLMPKFPDFLYNFTNGRGWAPSSPLPHASTGSQERERRNANIVMKIDIFIPFSNFLKKNQWFIVFFKSSV